MIYPVFGEEVLIVESDVLAMNFMLQITTVSIPKCMLINDIYDV